MTTTTMKRTETRRKGDTFCRLIVRLEDGRLSITGESGRILKRARAKREARESWESFFEDNPDEIRRMAERFGRRFTSPRGAAAFVLEVDGEFHGLDVVGDEGDDVLVLDSCGMNRGPLAEHFPEAVPFFPYHLNDMHAGCPHQRARDERYDVHGGVICMQCGWKLGAGWYADELPPEVEAWSRTGEGTPPAPRQDVPMRVFAAAGRARRQGALGRVSPVCVRGWATSEDDATARAHEALTAAGYENTSFSSVVEVTESEGVSHDAD